MNTTNLISTPNIEGNIGSCATRAEVVTTHSGWVSEEGFTVLTNSCTGSVTREPYYSVGFPAIIGAVILGIFIILMIPAWFASM